VTKRVKGRPKKRRDVDVSELRGIVARTGTQPISADEQEKLRSAIETLAFLTAEIEAKGTSIEQLRYFLFGARSERASKVLDKSVANNANASAGGDGDGGDGKNAADKPKGHGRNGASAYPGATKVRVPHPGLCGGDGCPECIKGKVYPLEEPSTLVRVRGVAPLQATLYARDRLRCNLCGEVFTAPSPAGVGETKYDETATSMVALLKYGTGLAFNRIETLQAGMGIPLPAATQWDLVHAAAKKLAPAYDELIRQAAQGKVERAREV